MFFVNNNLDVTQSHEALIIGLFSESPQLNSISAQIDTKLDGYVSQLLKDGDISSKRKMITKIHTLGKLSIKRIYFVGLGNKEELTFELVREIFGKTFKAIKEANLESVSISLDTFCTKNLTTFDLAHALGEAFPLATYKFADYKQKQNTQDKEITSIMVYSQTEADELKASLVVGYTYGKATNSARTLVNLPGNMLTAGGLADYARELAEKYCFEIEILEKEEMQKLGMGALLAVNQGSVEPPKMIVLKYQGKEKWNHVIGLVGKGITFDTGGYSIKTKDGLVGMKSDMGGAAAVLGAMEIIGELRPEQNVVAVIPSTDNMISGSAFKPDDVIKSMSGKTIEVLNTDAEGRLALADGLTYAKHLGANYLIDVATLTGGIVVALGHHTTGAMTNNEEFFEQVLEASLEAGEPIWRLPIYNRDKERVRNSKVADLNNSPGRDGHAIMAGTFVGEFAEDTPWVHLDIAGTAGPNKNFDLGPDGATGVMVRTLATLVERFHKM